MYKMGNFYHDDWRAQAHLRSGRSSNTSYSSTTTATTTTTNPSFSSTLLDAIYRSIDEADHSVERRTESFRVASKPNWKLLLLHNNHQDDAALTPSTPSDLHYLCKPRQHLRYLQQQRRDPFVLPSSSASTSCSSSSSSDTDSGIIPICLKPYRAAADHPPHPDPAIKRRCRISRIYGEPKKAKAKAKAKKKAPSSPGGLLASFLRALFLKATAKAKAEGRGRPRFCPVEEKRRISERMGFSDGRRGEFDLPREEEEDGGASSDSSSDLFELEDLTAVGRRGFVDDLPVYGSTRVGAIRSGAPSRRVGV